MRGPRLDDRVILYTPEKPSILSLSFRLASRAYGLFRRKRGTVEQGSYSYTPPEEEVEKGQTINKLEIIIERIIARRTNSVLCNKQKTEI